MTKIFSPPKRWNSNPFALLSHICPHGGLSDQGDKGEIRTWQSVAAIQRVAKLAIVCYRATVGKMNVSLTDELETIVHKKVKSGLYNNASEVVRDALRRAFCQPQQLDLEKDTPELAALVRAGARSHHTRHREGDLRKLLSRVR